MFGGARKPTHFICLVLKMLQIQPEEEIAVEFVKQSEFKYVRALGAMWIRFVACAFIYIAITVLIFRHSG